MKKIIGVLIACMIAGCSATPHYDAHFGESVRQARTQMTINPDAGKRGEPAGMDGNAAKLAIDRYHDSFKAPPPVVNVINIGGSMGTGK